MHVLTQRRLMKAFAKLVMLFSSKEDNEALDYYRGRKGCPLTFTGDYLPHILAGMREDEYIMITLKQYHYPEVTTEDVLSLLEQ